MCNMTWCDAVPMLAAIVCVIALVPLVKSAVGLIQRAPGMSSRILCAVMSAVITIVLVGMLYVLCCYILAKLPILLFAMLVIILLPRLLRGRR